MTVAGTRERNLLVLARVHGRTDGSRLTQSEVLDEVDASRTERDRALAHSTDEHVPTTALTGRIWDLRHNVSAYDAAYDAAAEASLCPLVTLDGRLAKVSGLRCEVRALGA